MTKTHPAKTNPTPTSPTTKKVPTEPHPLHAFTTGGEVTEPITGKSAIAQKVKALQEAIAAGSVPSVEVQTALDDLIAEVNGKKSTA